MDIEPCATAEISVPTLASTSCPFKMVAEIEALPARAPPYWHALLRCRHIGIHRPDERNCNWTARILTKDKRYVQKCLGPALDGGKTAITYDVAVSRAFEWFETGAIKAIASQSKPVGRTTTLNFCPLGLLFTVGHALSAYMEWTRITRSAGGHYNNLTMINHHLGGLLHIPLDAFSTKDLKALAVQVIETPPRFGFSRYMPKVCIADLDPDELRKRKKTFNSLVTILRMAFQHAWECGDTNSERSWRCLKRIAVNHSPRTIFLNRNECARLVENCTPALRTLAMAALYTGCRIGELADVRAEDVGHQIFGLRIAAFKTGQARFVFLPDEGMAFFLNCCEGKSGRDRVLLSDRGKVWRRQHANLFRRAVARAKLPEGFVFHGLRHTYASDLVRQGVPLDIVARQLGHADIKTVSSTYGHLAEQYREEQIRTRFTPLSAAQQAEAQNRRAQLDTLWQSFQTDDWRSYGARPSADVRPPQSHLRTSVDVLEAFRR